MPSRSAWYAVGQIIAPEPFRFTGRGGIPGLGIQSLAVLDVDAGLMLHCAPLARIPGTLTANEVIGVLEEVFEKYGAPADGVVLTPSVWRSSEAMLDDDETRSRGELLKRWGISFPSMDEFEREAVRQAISSLGLNLRFELPETD